jgi:hypothetical protein
VILLAGKADPVLPDPDNGSDDADRKTAAFEQLALLDMGFEIADMPPALRRRAGPAGEADLAQCVAHGSAAAAVACGVDIGFGQAADKRAAAEKTSEMAFLIAPGRDFDRAVDAGGGVENAGGFEGTAVKLPYVEVPVRLPYVEPPAVRLPYVEVPVRLPYVEPPVVGLPYVELPVLGTPHTCPSGYFHSTPYRRCVAI